MSKLYPPQVEGTLPAVAKGNALIVPFQLNRAVSQNDFTQLSIIVKTVQTNTMLSDGEVSSSVLYDVDSGYFKAIFDDEELLNKLVVGAYYKVQVAFKDKTDGTIGYYSNAAIVKCTAYPDISISGLTASSPNPHQYSYTGIYSQNGDDKDKTEKVYSYRFDLKDPYGNIVATSGDLIHNNAEDTQPYQSSDTWNVSKNLEPGDKYIVQYSVRTLNNLVAQSYSYEIMVVESVGYNFPANLSAEMYNDDGYVEVSIKPSIDTHQVLKGSFVLIRGSEEDNYDTWQELYRFDLVNKTIDTKVPLWKDFTVQQGMRYKYAIQAYNSNSLYSTKIFNVEGPIFADFEDAFLFDGERQLNIKYNPKVSSFKTTILESKMDTLGGQHPFIFRNGNVHYQEFPISGLISMLSDPNNLFTSAVTPLAQDKREKTKSSGQAYQLNTHLIGENFMQERKFKLEVLNWLNDGKPKLFRSPGEGNYIVRLMNVSLSPNDTLGRMLHTFSCTAYEIAEYNFTNLDKYGFVDTPIIPKHAMSIGEEFLRKAFGGAIPADDDKELILENPLYMLSIHNQQFDSLVLKFTYANGIMTGEIDVKNPTGSRHIDIIDGSPITKITYVSGTIAADAKMAFAYQDFNITNNFSQITDIKIEDKIAQYIGGDFEENLIETLEDIKFETGKFYYIKATPRNVIELYEKEGLFYKDSDMVVPFGELQPTDIYHIVNQDKTWYYGSTAPEYTKEVSPDFRIQLNNDTYSNLKKIDRTTFRTQGDFKAITDINRVDILKFGSGIILDLVYQMKTIEYEVETTNTAVKNSKKAWEVAVKEYEEAVKDEDYSTIKDKKGAMDYYYQIYITNLRSALEGGSSL